MARKTIKIEIPTGSPDDMITLAEDIKTRHDGLGSAATLDNDDVTAMADKAAQAKAKRKQAAELSAQAETLNLQAATLLGVAPGQSSETKDTVLFHIDGIRDELLLEHRGTEQALGEYGFDISIGTAKTPGPRKPKP